MIAYTDGGCSGNPGPGGWGVVLRVPEIDRGVNQLDRGQQALQSPLRRRVVVGQEMGVENGRNVFSIGHIGTAIAN